MPKDAPIPPDLLELLATHEEALRAYARSLLPTWDAVDETMQDAYLVMVQKMDQLETPDAFLPWGKVIVRFQSLKTRRKFARDRLVFSEDLIEMLAHEGLNAIDTNDMEIWQQALDECLKLLSAPNRDLVLAPYRSNEAVVHMAEKSGRTVNSLYKLLGRLRLKLRECVEEKLGPDTLESYST